MFLTEVLIKLGLSALLAIIIGLEREIRKKPLGLKTSLVICLTSCLLTIISIESADRYSEQGQMVMDPMRLAAQIVSGIGFLGAGVILRKNNDSILGLTTAAIIWGAAGIGITVGAGFYYEATICTIMLIISVEILPKIVKWIGPKTLREKEIKLRFVIKEHDILPSIITNIEKCKIQIANIHVRESKDHILITSTLKVSTKQSVVDIYGLLKTVDKIQQIELENL